MESIKKLERIEEMINEEIKPLVSKNDISPAELKNLGEAIDILKDIETIKAMKKADEEDTMYSRENGNSYGMRGRSYDGMPIRGEMQESHGYSERMMPYPYYYYDNAPANNPANNPGGNQNANPSTNTMNTGTSNTEPMHSMNSMDGRRGRDADNDGRYSEDGSYRRGRDARGRYTSRDYSRHTDREMMIEHLEDMADDARTERERRTIEKCIDKLTRY